MLVTPIKESFPTIRQFPECHTRGTRAMLTPTIPVGRERQRYTIHSHGALVHAFDSGEYRYDGIRRAAGFSYQGAVMHDGGSHIAGCGGAGRMYGNVPGRSVS